MSTREEKIVELAKKHLGMAEDDIAKRTWADLLDELQAMGISLAPTKKKRPERTQEMKRFTHPSERTSTEQQRSRDSSPPVPRSPRDAEEKKDKAIPPSPHPFPPSVSGASETKDEKTEARVSGSGQDEIGSATIPPGTTAADSHGDEERKSMRSDNSSRAASRTDQKVHPHRRVDLRERKTPLVKETEKDAYPISDEEPALYDDEKHEREEEEEDLGEEQGRMASTLRMKPTPPHPKSYPSTRRSGTAGGGGGHEESTELRLTRLEHLVHKIVALIRRRANWARHKAFDKEDVADLDSEIHDADAEIRVLARGVRVDILLKERQMQESIDSGEVRSTTAERWRIKKERCRQRFTAAMAIYCPPKI